jgi:uncharacterized protein (TIGR03083 family)
MWIPRRVRMTLSRTVVVPGMAAEYQNFVDLLRGLSDDEWSSPSRCDDWRVADVAAHVVGQLSDVTNFRLEGLGTDEVTKRQVDERRGQSPDVLADELQGAVETARVLVAAFDDDAWSAEGPQGNGTTLGFGIESLWFDTFLHADDIRTALDRPTVTGDGLLPSVSHIAQVLTDQGWGPATLKLEGIDEFLVSGGAGDLITGDPMTFILVSSGRAPASTMGLDDTVNIYR